MSKKAGQLQDPARRLDIKGTPLLGRILKLAGRVRVLEGGSRSSKTWSIIQSLIVYCAQHEGKVITAGRSRMTWHKAGVIKDFKEICRHLGIWDPGSWNATTSTYNMWGNEWNFTALDDPGRLHGRKQDIAWINEAIECTIEDFDQLEMRTSEYLILDYNPLAVTSWIYDRVLTRPDVDYIHSTQLDNPFLGSAQRAKIMSFEPTPDNISRGTADDHMWKVYGLGQRAHLEGQIYTNYSFVKDFPTAGRVWYGCDFGFTNDPTAVLRVCVQSGELWVDQILYDRGLTNKDISDRLEGSVEKGRPLWCDSAEPKSIEDLCRYGWNAMPTKKGPDSVRNGIDILRSYKINITERSLDIRDELTNYTWRRDRAGLYTNEPVDRDNHLLDALRYVALMELANAGPAPTTLGAKRYGSRASYGQQTGRPGKRSW